MTIANLKSTTCSSDRFTDLVDYAFKAAVRVSLRADHGMAAVKTFAASSDRLTASLANWVNLNISYRYAIGFKFAKVRVGRRL